MINSVFYVIFTFTFVCKTLYKELKIIYSNFYEQAHPNHDKYLNKKLDMYEAMSNLFQLKMKENMKKLQKVKRHLHLIPKRGNIRRDIERMKMIVLKSCLKRLEM